MLKQEKVRNANTDEKGAADVLLSVEGLVTEFGSSEPRVKAVRNVSFELKSGEVLGIVGESGSGKSVTGRSILRIVREPGRITAGNIYFDSVDLLKLAESDMRAVRGGEIAMIYQEPSAALNPVLTIGDQIVEVLMTHRNMSKSSAWSEAIERLREVGIPAPERRVSSYPHQLSGGMLQRCTIAIALACGAKLIIADEPTTALDVTIQAQILKLLLELVERHNVSLILITHDIAVVAQTADRIMVMYGGRVMEEGTVDQIVERPKHPYTIELLKAMPSVAVRRGEKLRGIVGDVPNLLSPPPGCPFGPRCSQATEVCNSSPPMSIDEGRRIACWLNSGSSGE